MQESIWLSTTALDRIKQLNALGDYPQAYQVIIDETEGTGYSGRKWFTSAAGVNQGKGYTSAFIRTYTQLAKLLKNEKCHTFSDQELKTASDEIAVAVLTWVINREGLLPSFETIMEIDSGTAIMSLKITPIQWAGTPVSPLVGYKGPVPKMTHDWLIVFQASYHAVLSSIFDGTADYIQAFFKHLIKHEEK